jgi:flap endonuclease-1
MGIRNLNRYLRTQCPNSLKCIHLKELSGKKVVIDISIYLYKYETDNVLLENIYMMLSIFTHYNITPIFIFDGKPPQEKKALLIKRREEREEAKEEYNRLKQLLENENENDNDKDKENKEIISEMDRLKRQIVQVNKDKIEKVKSLIRAWGATYYDARGEADELCALLVMKQKVWACLSEDMDLFVYGCPRVLRYFSLLSHTAVLYDLDGILKELQMSHNEFKEICIISGTDYNLQTNSDDSKKINLYMIMKLFQDFKNGNPNKSFYDWMQENSNLITNIDVLKKINNMFDLSATKKLDVFKKIQILNGPKMQKEIEEIMKEEDFIFLPK